MLIKNNLKKLILVFSYSLILNLIWENLHSSLYLYYKSSEINEWILLRASLADAFIILSILVLAGIVKSKRYVFIIISAFTISYLIEKWALVTGRWQYGAHMPIVPWLNIGLTPFVQLGLIGCLVYYLVNLSKDCS